MEQGTTISAAEFHSQLSKNIFFFCLSVLCLIKNRKPCEPSVGALKKHTCIALVEANIESYHNEFQKR